MKRNLTALAGILLSIHSASLFAADTIETAGDITQVALPVAAIGATIYYKDKPGFYQFAYAGLTTVATVQALKYSVYRERPNGHPKSFPSGHTAAAFVGAGFLQMRYGWAYGVPAYLLAGFTGYSRVESKNHWTSDVIAGAAIGIGTNLIFTSKYSNNLNMTPYVEKDRKESGIELTATF